VTAKVRLTNKSNKNHLPDFLYIWSGRFTYSSLGGFSPVRYSTLFIIPGAKLGVLEASDDIVKRGGAEEVLLLEAQLLPLEHVVVRIEHAGDVLSQVPVQHSLTERFLNWLFYIWIIPELRIWTFFGSWIRIRTYFVWIQIWILTSTSKQINKNLDFCCLVFSDFFVTFYL
jgi:hypothetical protein